MDTYALAKAIDRSPTNRGASGDDWVADFLDGVGNVAYQFGPDSFVLFTDEGDNIFEVHMLFGASASGKDRVGAGRAAFSAMFIDHGAEMIFGLVPFDFRHAKIHARLVGGKSVGKRDTPNGACELFVLSRHTWERKK